MADEAVYYNDIPVGSVCCRIEGGKLYIMILVGLIGSKELFLR